ncbi:putative C6 transcription factor [Aspergillus steynii IBT 23096]|uniref:Putative C6 transcription factor n=1 Tax=Aspergillus steynii IBT 23096 TaxID=1392250 RepID=A0A2I2FRE9_9EURO|nr:putative C6 transcription factor [Aspergillus steynii IBT 23096]PLB43187.1 putative C6 transcription factor [Aspergillus steynii IBT 23096]
MTDHQEPARKRSRVACVSCQSRKRKCSGDQPCTTCCQFGVDCHYDLLSRKKKDIRYLRPPSGPGSILDESFALKPPPQDQTQAPAAPGADSPRVDLSSLEANSGAAFVRRLGLKMDPANAPRLHMFAWNVGVRHPPPSPMPPSSPAAAVPVTETLSQDEMRALVAVFFEKVDPCYGFLDRDSVLRQVSRRWLPPSNESALPYGPYDAVLCGIAAFGYLFSHRQAIPTELQLVDTARLILEHHLQSETSSVDIVTGMVLRVGYLRMTSSPHAAWMASCSLMHLIEASGLHLEQAPDTMLDHSPELCDPETRRRLYGMARHFNVWISFELGRTRVVLHGATSATPTPRQTGHPTEIFNLLPVSESLDPNKSPDTAELETALTNVLDDMHLHLKPALILAQCNLMLCIYRRLRALNHATPGKLLDRVLELAGKGLHATRDMVNAICPWHQVANVPFQIVCTLLAIDNRASLGLLNEAMRTLREVATAYDTAVMREAYSTAYLLVVLHQQRKEEDTKALRDVLNTNPSSSSLPQAPAVENQHLSLNLNRHQQQQPLATPMPTAAAESTHSLADYPGFSWLSDILIDIPGLQNFDLDNFLTTDLPGQAQDIQ